MITFDGVRKRFGETVALDDVSFEIESGEIFGYIGPNGAGKTTSIKILTGLIRDYEGRVSLDGIDAKRRDSAIHRLVGYMPQEAGFQEWRTVRHALRTFGLLSGLEARDLARKIDYTLDLLGLDEYRDTRITHLSGGTVQKVKLAQAILHDPLIIILDEPMSGLDPASRFRVKEIIRSLQDSNKLVFFSSHILSDVEDLATKIAILANGKLRLTGSPGEIRKAHNLGRIIEITFTEAKGDLQIGRTDIAGLDRIERSGANTAVLHFDTSDELSDSMRRTMIYCVENGFRVSSVRQLEPNLEAVYLKLTEETDES